MYIWKSIPKKKWVDCSSIPWRSLAYSLTEWLVEGWQQRIWRLNISALLMSVMQNMVSSCSCVVLQIKNKLSSVYRTDMVAMHFNSTLNIYSIYLWSISCNIILSNFYLKNISIFNFFDFRYFLKANFLPFCLLLSLKSNNFFLNTQFGWRWLFLETLITHSGNQGLCMIHWLK